MSGGFFRGTSADQDTRFSNKQAKLLKTQKFAPELDHLVDMTKVKMDVMKPWIARRVTELLGFEDEVLINFVYGLLDAKEVDGKQIQIQLTGFMEKNTGKFMRELWGLLLSAQKNASGVPQQFLDEKEEEMRKKKVESDRITQEIQKKKDREDLEADYAKQKRMDGEADSTRHVDAASDAGPKNSVWRDSSANLEEEREIDGRHGSRRMSRHRSISPHSDNQSPLLQRNSHAKSSSRSFSNSRSYTESEDGHKSRSVSVSASPPRRSTSQDQRPRSRAKYSVSPNQRRSPQITRSASRQRSPYMGRSPSPVRRRSPSPVRRRSPSPVRRRSPSPVCRRSPFRVRRRSPSLHRRSPTSLRRRSPASRRRSPSPPRRHSPPRPRYQSPQHRYRRSPSPSWHRFPLRRRSPMKLRRRSPSPAREISPQRRSQSPARRRSPSPFRRRSTLPRSPVRRRRSPLHHAVDLRSSPRQRNMSQMQNSQRSRSPSQSHGSLSMEHANHGDGVESERNRRSSLHSLKRDKNEKADFGSSRIDSPSSEQWQIVRSETNVKKSHSLSCEGDMNKSGNSGRGLSRSPARQSRSRKDRYNSLEASRGENPDAREGSFQKTHCSSKRSPYSPTRASVQLSRRTNSGDFFPERVEVKESLKVRGNQIDVKLKEHHEQRRNVEHSGSRIEPVSHLPEDVEYGPGKVGGNFLPDGPDNKRSSRKRQSSSSPDERPRNENNHQENSYSKEASRTDEKKRLHIEDKSNYAKKSRKQLDESYQVCPVDTDSEEDAINISHGNEKRSKKSEINEAASEDYDSALDHRKEAKRKRKEERRMRKEEKRRRRDEKHRRREERRAQKNSKYIDTVTPPPDYEINNSVANNSDEATGLRVSKTSDMEETESEQKQLEIDLRNKALESLRAKKAISH